jgi:O-antigen/teichoic acid export membrane protein
LKDASQALFLIVLSLGFTLIYTPYRAALVSQLRHDVDHYTKIITVPLRAGIVVTCFALIEPSLRLWAIAWLVSAILAFGFQRFQAHRHCPSLEVKKRWVTRRGFRDLAGFGVYTSVAQLSNLLDRSSGPLIISYFLGTAAVAHYMPALILVVAMQSLSGAFIIQLNPVVTKAHARSDYALIGSILIRSTRYSLLLSGGAAVGIGALAFTFIPLWLGEGFRDTAIVLVIWCVATVLRASVGGALPIFLGTGKLRAVTAVNAALAAAGVAASIYFVGFTDFGVVGATFGVLVTQVARTAVYIVTAMRIAGVGLSQYFRESYQGPLLCLALVAATSLGTQAALGSNAWIKLAAGGGLSLLVFAILAWTVGLNARDRRKALDYGRIAVNWARSAFS